MATNISNLTKTETKYFSISLKIFTRMLIDGRKMRAKIHNPWDDWNLWEFCSRPTKLREQKRKLQAMNKTA
jgi:hypothetical protein